MALAELSELPRQPSVSVAFGGRVVESRRRGSIQAAHRQRVLARAPEHDPASTRRETREGEGRGGRAGTHRGYKDRWRDGLRNGDIERFAPGKQTRRASGGGGSGATSASKSPSTSTRTIASKLGASSAEEALKEIESTAPRTHALGRQHVRPRVPTPCISHRRVSSRNATRVRRSILQGSRPARRSSSGWLGSAEVDTRKTCGTRGSMQPLSFHH